MMEKKICDNCQLFMPGTANLGWRQCSVAENEDGNILMTKASLECICTDEYEE